MVTLYVNDPPERRGIGLIPQNYALFPHTNVKDNIEIGLRTKNLSKAGIKRRTKELIEIFSLEHINEKYLHETSSGGRRE